MIPRTYDKTIPPGKESAFRLTSRYGREFGQDFGHLLGDSGRTIIKRNMEEFNVIKFLPVKLNVENLRGPQNKRRILSDTQKRIRREENNAQVEPRRRVWTRIL